jgi:hypothetical protein
MRTSHSAVSKMLNCGYEYFLHYFWKLRPIEDKSSFITGDCVDAGLNHLLLSKVKKIDPEVGPPEKTKTSEEWLSEALQKFHEKWEKRAKSGNIKYAKSDLDAHLVEGMQFDSEKDKYYTAVKLRGEILIQEYSAQVIPRIKEVIKIQPEALLYNTKGDEITIKGDFIAVWEDNRRILFDNKTSVVKYDENAVRDSAQLGLYFEGFKDEYKLDAAGYIVIPKKTNKFKKPRVLIDVKIGLVDPTTVQKLYQDFEDSLEKIKSAQFPKNEKNCVNIYGKCVYYKYCHGGDLTGLKEKEEKKYE